MSTGLTIWLVVFGVILIASFWIGTYFLLEWKEGVMNEAYYGCDKEGKDWNSRQSYAKAVAQSKISRPIALVSYIFTLASVLGILLGLVNLA